MTDLQKLFPMISLAGITFIIVMGIVFSFGMYFALDNETGNTHTTQSQQANNIVFTWIYIIASILIIISVSTGLAIAKGWLFKKEYDEA
jgi:magnesium-transporting ATPase (P-type)